MTESADSAALRRRRRIGLTGGIASGKSMVSRMLAARGALVIDADQLARQVIASGTPGFTAVVDAFGSDVLDATGDIDRAKLGTAVFADSEKRRRLESIIHPLVRAEAARLEASAPADQIVIHDIPLLVETGQQGSFDAVIVVDTSPDIQLDRLVRNRGMRESEAWQRIASQASRDARRQAATELVENNGSLAELELAVEQMWDRLLKSEAS
jgi:dephospho-CoA kinase